MKTADYNELVTTWPTEGRHILASHDAGLGGRLSGLPACDRTLCGLERSIRGEFSFSRMSWIKPNFLWMMYRSGWGAKEGQEVILAVTIPRTLLTRFCERVASSFDATRYRDTDQWKADLDKSDVRLQWDPDHAPVAAS